MLTTFKHTHLLKGSSMAKKKGYVVGVSSQKCISDTARPACIGVFEGPEGPAPDSEEVYIIK